MWDIKPILSAAATFAVRAASTAVVVGLRGFGLATGKADGPRAAQGFKELPRAIADEMFLASELLSAPVEPLHRASVRARVTRELEDALALFEWRGWLDQPTHFHLTPAPLERPKLTNESHNGLTYQHLRFPSEWEPPRAAPRRGQWLGDAPNRTAHAWLLKHGGAQRPWIVCLPGYRMGTPSLDFTAFRAQWLHESLGLNVAIPVLPFHGPRASGWRSGDGLLTGNTIDGVYAIAQGVWDTRRIIRWLRRQGAPSVGLYGISLGAYTAGIVAGLERELTCAIAGVPVSSWPALMRANLPSMLAGGSEWLGLPWGKVERLLRVISPLAIEPLLPIEQRFVFAAEGDRLAHPAQARALSAHWGLEAPGWVPGAHATFWLEPEVQDFVYAALERSGMLHLSADTARRAAASAAQRGTTPVAAALRATPGQESSAEEPASSPQPAASPNPPPV